MGNSSTNVLIIGAGQAGLAAAYYLGPQHMDYIIVDAHSEIGQAWKTRYVELATADPNKIKVIISSARKPKFMPHLKTTPRVRCQVLYGQLDSVP